MTSRILLVDDDPALLDALPVTIRLHLPDVEVDSCDSAAAALRKLDDPAYEVIVTDIKMPGMDGLSLLKAIRERRPDVPTVLISGHGEHDLTVQALRGGAYDFVQKPIDRDYFIATVERALETRRLQEAVACQQDQLRRHADQLAATVEERTRQLRSANDAKDEFLALISHEMRTPLTLISGGLSVLLRREPDALTAHKLLEDMAVETERLGRIVEDLLVLARAELVDATDLEPLSVSRIAARAVAQERERSGRDIELVVEPGSPLAAGDETYVERVILNLLSNATKYSSPDSPLAVQVCASAGGVAVAVLDRGVGISEAEADAIFSHFYRSPKTAARTKGAGVGLTVCKRLVESLGGEIWAKPRPGGGTEVCFTLPLYREHWRAEALDESEMAARV